MPSLSQKKTWKIWKKYWAHVLYMKWVWQLTGKRWINISISSRQKFYWEMYTTTNLTSKSTKKNQLGWHLLVDIIEISTHRILGLLCQSLWHLPHNWLKPWEISLTVDKPHLHTLSLYTYITGRWQK